ncbi:Tripartite motif-containing protein 2 [Holothuria leucospilota]|uniref:Tripartite motif-containing protein 2 n=1 Tax=Holothuria leucospilota TaxID=206669 RepID=A0A9Q1HFJ5_HOLLE|nr:Tripartite motif-containing protein 2 [Holothuria leucospilota]
MGTESSKSKPTSEESGCEYDSCSSSNSEIYSQSQSRDADPSSKSSKVETRKDNPNNISTSQSSDTGAASTTPTACGARPKLYRADSCTGETSLQTPAAYLENDASSTQKMPLYMAESLSSLSEKIDQNMDWSNTDSIACKARFAMFTANKAYEKKDEEKAYVLYNRYAQMWAHVGGSTDNKNLSSTCDHILGSTDIHTACNRINELKVSLESRYTGQSVAQATAPVSGNTNLAGIGKSKRKTSQPMQYQHPSDANIPGSKPSQTSSTPIWAGSVLSQTMISSESGRNQASRTDQQQQGRISKKDLRAGVETGLEENLLCPICLDLFENAKSLPCGHAVCEGCIEKWVSGKGGVLSCPTCKTVQSLPSRGVTGLAANIALNNLVTEVKRIYKEESDINEVAEGQRPNAATIQAMRNISTPPSALSRVPSAKSSFLERYTMTGYKDVRGSTTKMRVQLRDSAGNNLRGRKCDKVGANVITPTNEKENVSVSLMNRDGDYNLSFIPNKSGVYFVEAYLDNVPVCGSPLKIIVHPSGKLNKTINNHMDDPKDMIIKGSIIYATDDCGAPYLSADWQGNLNYPCEDKFDEGANPFGIGASNNYIFVTVPNQSCVYVYDYFGNYKTSFGKKFLQFPTGIAISKAGMIYVADSTANAIHVFRPNFSHLHSIPADGNAGQCSLALLALNPGEDRLIAADRGSDGFKIFDVVNLQKVKAIKTNVHYSLVTPFGVAVDEDENILVSVTFKRGGHNQRNNTKSTGAILTYNSEGYFLGKFGENELKMPRGLCIVEDKVVVLDEGGGMPSCLRVYKL